MEKLITLPEIIKGMQEQGATINDVLYSQPDSQVQSSLAEELPVIDESAVARPESNTDTPQVKYEFTSGSDNSILKAVIQDALYQHFKRQSTDK